MAGHQDDNRPIQEKRYAPKTIGLKGFYLLIGNVKVNRLAGSSTIQFCQETV